ncbi:MAG TPA: poly-gamma-glutamate system protein [Myxococcota bacterium]|nr:poly-gamma-glutamate system protein [Myxococcota bacterium]
MQKLYWRSARISRAMYLLASLIALAMLLASESFKETIVQPHYEEKIEAARLMQRAMEAIQNHRVRKVGPIDLEADPTNSGMLGLSSSVTTTNTGSLEAKRTTLNPNWAAVVVELLSEAGVERGSTIAVGVSGSFPALNLAVFSAAEVLDLEAISIASVGASSWGANVPTLTWLDMERVLADAGILRTRSIAASLGGTRDRAIGMPKLGRKRLRQAIERAAVPYLATETDLDSIERRMALYREQADDRYIQAYVNVGGSLASIGPKTVKRLYQPGLNLRLDPHAVHVDSVMKRFLRDGVPVINLSKIVPLAELYGLPLEPIALPQPGEGLVFERQEYNRWLVAGLLGLLLLSLWALLRLDVGSRVAALSGRARSRPLEPMV